MLDSISPPGGSAVSEFDRPFSQARLSTYQQCPRLYEFKYHQDITTPDRTERYLIQGNAFHEVVERTCESVTRETPAESVHARAMELFPDIWAAQVVPDEFASRAQQEYYRRQTLAALTAYFDETDGAGIDHARYSVAVEARLAGELNGIPVRGYVDNILQTETGVHLLDYKRSRRGIISSRTADRLPEHLAGDAYEPGRVKSAIQATLYRHLVRESDICDPEDEVTFSYYVYLYDDEFEPGADGYTISVSGKEYDVTDLCSEYSETILDLIEASATGIRAESFEPAPWPLIREDTCDDCDYRQMCPNYLASEVD